MFKNKPTPQKNNTKTKYNTSNNNQTSKNSHSRSLVDLNPQELNATNKQNNSNLSSASSHRQNNQQFSSKVLGQYHRSNSNIAKLLGNHTSQSRNNSKKLLQHKPHQTNIFNKQITRKSQNKPQFSYNIEKQMRTASQTSLQSTENVKVQKRNDADYKLLLKLKGYIEELKKNQIKYQEELKHQNQLLEKIKEENVLLEDKVKVLEIRDRELVRKIKTAQQKKKNEGSCHNCHQNSLIIQSLKNVINEQLTKIIQLERNRLQAEEEDKKSNRVKNSVKQKNLYASKQLTSSIQLDEDQSFMSNNHQQKSRGNEQQVYSFKKDFHQDDEEGQDFKKIKFRGIQEVDQDENEGRRVKSSLDGIPEPYQEVIKGMKQDEEQENWDNGQGEYEQSYSQDGILQQVGNYLSNIRNDVKSKKY